MSDRKIKALERKAKMGWASYYRLQEEHHSQISGLSTIICMLNLKINESDNDEKEHIPDFLKNELVEMYDKLKKEIECPICFTELKSDEIKFSSCGHKFCGECLSKLDNCAICRKKIYRKK
tara:strand:+ start:750 stop:1112 length:363 start_codon:yes stop_codon:yes gene_type:complete